MDAIPEDAVGVVVKWQPPSITIMDDPVKAAAVQAEVAKGNYRHDAKADDWVGPVIAGALGLDIKEPGIKKLVTDVLGAWVDKGWFVIVEDHDANRHKRKYVRVGKKPDINHVFDDESETASVASVD